MEFSDIIGELSASVDALRFGPPVAYVYNPLSYAREPFLEYLRRFGKGPKRAIFVGMNPGPWGMAQTGVPFGEVDLVGGWMGITGLVGKPSREHPARKVEGFACKRHEVSGKRLWGWAAARFGQPEKFFGHFLVLNYCPLMFMEEGGKNRTPDKLPATERAALEAVCDRALLALVSRVGAEKVVGVGGYAREAARRALASTGVEVASITHPSPANPAANRGWSAIVERELSNLGLLGD